MIRVDLKGFDRLAKDFDAIKQKALPHATRTVLNELASQGRDLWRDEMRSRFILRNEFTTRRVLVDKARGVNITGMRSVLFTDNPDMLKQEEGGTETHAIATGVASGEGYTSTRHKLVRRPNQVSAIQLTARLRTGSRAQRNAAAIRMAAASGAKWVFLELQRRKGLFRLSGGRKKLRVDMVWDTSKKAHKVPPHPTLQPAVKRLEQKVPSIMLAAVVQQLKHHKVFGY